jgi:NADH dehydrogenase (ubiquinone) 1 beta subcomplex subunit 8
VLTCNQVLEEEDRLGMWGPDIHKTTPFSALMQLSLALSLVGGFAYILSVTRPESPVAKRDYPYNGLEKELGGHGGARAEQPVLDDE